LHGKRKNGADMRTAATALPSAIEEMATPGQRTPLRVLRVHRHIRVAGFVQFLQQSLRLGSWSTGKALQAQLRHNTPSTGKRGMVAGSPCPPPCSGLGLLAPRARSCGCCVRLRLGDINPVTYFILIATTCRVSPRPRQTRASNGVGRDSRRLKNVPPDRAAANDRTSAARRNFPAGPAPQCGAVQAPIRKPMRRALVQTRAAAYFASPSGVFAGSEKIQDREARSNA